MRLYSFDQIKRELDPSGELNLTARWLRTQMGSVKIGKRLMVTEDEFLRYKQRLDEQCRAAQPLPVSSGEPTEAPTLSATEKAVANESVSSALKTVNKLKLRSLRSSKRVKRTLPDNVLVLPSSHSS